MVRVADSHDTLIGGISVTSRTGGEGALTAIARRNSDQERVIVTNTNAYSIIHP